jgi:diacylglycerol kinase (ATP)
MSIKASPTNQALESNHVPLDLKPNDFKSTMERQQSLKVAPNLLASFQFAWEGISYAFKTQRNFRIHTVVGIAAVALSIYLQLSAVELAVVTLTSGAVLGMELINTALESVVDLTIGQNYSPLAKIAKDCAAAAVLVSAIVALGVASSLLLPTIWRSLFL